MTKRNIIESALCNDLDIPTAVVINKIHAEYGVDVSPRHVQRVRKSMIEKFENDLKGIDDMGIQNDNDKNTFDSAHGLEKWQLDMINMINEPNKGDNFWSIQELAIILNRTDNEIRNTMSKFNFMLINPVLDEEKTNNIIHLPQSDITPDSPLFDDEYVKGEPSNNRSAARDDYWEVKIECVTACSKVPQSIDAFINKNARQKAMLFMKWAKAREWLAYLVGEKKDDGYHIYDLHLPDQRTSSTLVDKVNTDDYNKLSIVGVIHSHHEMGAGDEDRPSFSGHDSEFINSNHNLSLLAGKDREKGGFKVVGIARVQTPCGGFMKIKANVKPMKEAMSEKEQSLLNEFKGKVFGATNAGLAGKSEELDWVERHTAKPKGNTIQQRQFVDHRHMRGH